MKIYIDSIFIENLIITYIFLVETEQLIGMNVKKTTKWVASIISSIYVIILIVFKIEIFNMYIFKVLISIITGYIAFLPKKTEELLKITIVYLVITVLNIGSINYIKETFNITKTNILQKNIIYIVSFLLAFLCIKNLCKLLRKRAREEEYMYRVIINVGGHIEEYKGFLDTGNTVYSYMFGLPVIFADVPRNKKIREMIENKTLKMTEIEIQTINGRTVEKGYKLDDVEIVVRGNAKKNKLVVVFGKQFNKKTCGYNMILNNKIFERV